MEKEAKTGQINTEVFNMIFGTYAEMNPGLKPIFEQRGDVVHDKAIELIQETHREGGNIEFACQLMGIDKASDENEAIYTIAYFYGYAGATLEEIMRRDGPVDAYEESRRIARGLFALSK